MALPSSGSLSMGQIGQELGQSLSNLSLRNLSAMAEFSPSDSISEFYGFAAGGGGGDLMMVYSSGILYDPCSGRRVDIYQDRIDGMYYYSEDGGIHMIPTAGENVYFFEYEDYWNGWYYYNLIRFEGYKERWLGTWESQCAPY